MQRIAIRLLGPFEVTIDGAPRGFSYAKVRALLAFLAEDPGRQHSRAELATLLWPEQPDQVARASLSQALTSLRNALGDRTAAQPALRSDVNSVELTADLVDVDVVDFGALLRAAEAHRHRSWHTCNSCATTLRQALSLYRGSFLADVAIADSSVFEEWAAARREHLAQRALSVLERLLEGAMWRASWIDGLAYARRLVALEPLAEANQRAYMRLLALNGEVAAALAQYKQLERTLHHELAVEPESATTTLFEQIRRADTAALKPVAPPFVLPQPPTALLGRTAELKSLCTLLRDKVKCVTITGAGGIGKTRLAIEAAHLLRYDWEDGIYLVELAALSDSALVADTIARALGVQERQRQPIAESLRRHLSDKHLLLLLDNFEHVGGAAPLIGELLAACPALRVLVTSRVPLSIRAEQQLILEPLAEEHAVQLFRERAYAAGATVATDAVATAVYAALCQRLDRLPLAIELIAVRARAVAPRDLLQQLEQPLEALTRAPHDGAARHRSLRHAISWSYDLLDAEHQRVFRHLGVFAGGWSVEAAQAVLGGSSSVLPALETLNQASLLQPQVVAQQTRFAMLETIREFALEQLASCGEAEAARQRFADYYAAFAMEANVELLRSEATRWRALLTAERDNLRMAFGWAMQGGLHDVALRLATGVWRFHWMSGYSREALERLEAALEFGEQAPLELQAIALRAAGMLAVGVSDYPRARRRLEAAVQAGWRLNDHTALQPSLTNLGYALLEQGELEEARIHLEVSIELARKADDPTVAKFPLGILAQLLLRLGEHEQARALREESLRINRARRDPAGTADALRGLAEIVLAQGDTPYALQLGQEALALHSSLGHRLGMGMDHALLGDVAHMQGDYDTALARYQECLRLWQDRENLVNSAAVFDKLARTLRRIGAPERAASLLGAAAAIREQTGVKLAAAEQAAYEETLQACRAALGEVPLAAAWASGRALTLASAIELALG